MTWNKHDQAIKGSLANREDPEQMQQSSTVSDQGNNACCNTEISLKSL